MKNDVIYDDRDFVSVLWFFVVLIFLMVSIFDGYFLIGLRNVSFLKSVLLFLSRQNMFRFHFSSETQNRADTHKNSQKTASIENE